MLLAAGVTLQAFWFDPAFRADDHRAAVRELQARWRPGDVVVVNAGWAYTALVDVLERRNRRPLSHHRRPARAATRRGARDGHDRAHGRRPWPGLGRSSVRLLRHACGGREGSRLRTCSTASGASGTTGSTTPSTTPTASCAALLPRHGQLFDERTYPGEAYLDVEAVCAARRRGPGTTDRARRGLRRPATALRCACPQPRAWRDALPRS